MYFSGELALFDGGALINNLLDFFDELLEEVAGDDGGFFEVLDLIRILADEAVVEEGEDIDGGVVLLVEEFVEFFGDLSDFVVFGEHADFGVGFFFVELFPHL